MALEIEPVPRPDWTPVPRPGTTGVEGRVLLHTPSLLVAQLRFAPEATIDEHDAPHEIDAICLEGRGFVSVGGEHAPFEAGQRVHWPAGSMHRLWTEGHAMITLMLEHLA